MEFISEADDFSGRENANSLKVFVGNLPFAISRDLLHELFSSCGKVRGINLRTDRDTGKAKGYGFITFDCVEDAENAIAMNGYVLDGRRLTVSAATRRGEKNVKSSTVKPERKWELSSPIAKKGGQICKSWTSWTGISTESSEISKDVRINTGAHDGHTEPGNDGIDINRTQRDFKIENAKKSDYQEIFELINESYEVENGNSGIAFKKTPRLLSWDDSGMGEAYRKNTVLVARLNESDKIIGVISYHIPNDKDRVNDKCIHFGPLAVSPSYQRKGVALTLIREVESIGLENNCDFVEISVVNFRTDILPWYKRIGFEIVEEGQQFPDPERCTRACTFVILRMKLYRFSN